MPRISSFYGITITMHWNDHPPAHFHATYAGEVAHLDIETLELIDGYLPPRALRLVREWADAHRAALRSNWQLAQSHEPLEPIEPLP